MNTFAGYYHGATPQHSTSRRWGTRTNMEPFEALATVVNTGNVQIKCEPQTVYDVN